jgi:tetratricopeptide (TPR) repeat protein
MRLRTRGLAVLLVLSFSSFARAADNETLQKAQWHYQHEDYEEALILFKDMQALEPSSSELNYYLGMTYKKLQDYKAARPYLESAVTLTPSVQSALPELIDLLYQIDDTAAAKTWIERAERESAAPAQTAFFKGLTLLKEGEDVPGALRAFEEAESLDPTLAPTVKYQKGLARMRLEDYGQAKEIFEEIAAIDPGADLAAYANEYVDILSRREQAAKPFRGSAGWMAQYDDNVILKPTDDGVAGGVTGEDDFKQTFNAQGEYTFKPSNLMHVKAGYSLYGLHHDSIGFYDTLSHEFTAQPVFYRDTTAVAFPVRYNYVGVNEERYLETVGVSNVNNIMMGRSQMLQTQAGINSKEYSFPVSLEDERKDGEEYFGSLGWFWFFGRNKDGFFNLKYTLNYEDADGKNWKYYGNRFSASALVPLSKKWKWNSVAEYARQDFSNRNSVYEKDRHDNVLTVSNLLSYEFAKDVELQLQHTFVYDGASIGIYKYRKNVYGAGVRYRF